MAALGFYPGLCVAVRAWLCCVTNLALVYYHITCLFLVKIYSCHQYKQCLQPLTWMLNSNQKHPQVSENRGGWS